jgi:transcriptional regulator with XRE-family HTH domain
MFPLKENRESRKVASMSDKPLTEALLPDLGLALRILREQRKVRQADVARRAGMGKSQVSLYENGKQAPNFESLLRILAVLEADFHDLHNALQIATGKLDRLCASRPTREEDAAAEKLAQGIVLLLKAAQRPS